MPVESIHDEAARFNIERPTLERYTYTDNYGVTVIALTPESEQLWSNYLNAIGRARRNAHA